jgi:putative molybdenum carrier protein
MLKRIVSGGQTGADRAALDVATDCSLQIGGWIPKGRLAEDGPIPRRYGGLVETESSDPSVRTALNVRDSDATLIVSHGPLSGGSLETLNEARNLARPVFHLDLSMLAHTEALDQVCKWLRRLNPQTLNVAGPRGSEDPAIYRSVSELLRGVLPLISKPN